VKDPADQENQASDGMGKEFHAKEKDGLQAFGIPAFIDQLPEMLRFRQFLVLGERHFRTEKEIRESALVENAMDDHRAIFDLKVNAPIAGAKAIELLLIALDEAKTIVIERIEIALLHVKLIEQFELLESAHLRHFGGANFVKDNFQHEKMMRRFERLGKDTIEKMRERRVTVDLPR
jgi:hypothetical protein